MKLTWRFLFIKTLKTFSFLTDLGLFKRMKAWFLSELSDWRQICRPMYCDRMVLLLLGNAANWGLAIYGMVSTPTDFASYLLIIFLTNLLLYIAFYIIMKVSALLDTLLHKIHTFLKRLLFFLFLCLHSFPLLLLFSVFSVFPSSFPLRHTCVC